MNKSILVTGDVIRDIYLYEGDRKFPAQQGKIAPHFSQDPGGAAALRQIIAHAHPGTTDFGLRKPRASDRLQPVQTLWTACEGGTKQESEDAAKDAKPAKVWRVEKSLGYDLGVRQSKQLPRSIAAEAHHSVIVIDDAGLSFRTQPAANSWPVGVHQTEPQPDWIIHKMANPLAQGDLWRALTGSSLPGRRENLIVIVSADELRRAGAAVNRGYSLERTLT